MYLFFYCFKIEIRRYFQTCCIRLSDNRKCIMECRYCKTTCVKAGKNNNGKQKYYCSTCKKYQQKEYQYQAYKITTDERIILYIKNSCGIRSIGRLLNISTTTVMKRIRLIASSLSSNYSGDKGGIYEMDELHTFTGYKKNEQWLIYAINKGTRQVVDLLVGRRDKENIRKIVNKVLAYHPRKIFTDGLNIYPTLIDKTIHQPGRYITNRIERLNLTFRMHLKRLSRNTICYSKNVDMLEACMKIYLWT